MQLRKTISRQFLPIETRKAAQQPQAIRIPVTAAAVPVPALTLQKQLTADHRPAAVPVRLSATAVPARLPATAPDHPPATAEAVPIPAAAAQDHPPATAERITAAIPVTDSQPAITAIRRQAAGPARMDRTAAAIRRTIRRKKEVSAAA